MLIFRIRVWISDFWVWIRVWVLDFSDVDKPEKSEIETRIRNPIFFGFEPLIESIYILKKLKKK